MQDILLVSLRLWMGSRSVVQRVDSVDDLRYQTWVAVVQLLLQGKFHGLLFHLVPEH